MDVSKLCRSCMEEIVAWEAESLDQKVMEMFSFCTNIEIPKEDTLPKQFCYNCTVLLESFYAYVKKARRVNNKLKKLLRNSSENFVNNFLNKTLFLEEKVDENLDLNNFYEPEKVTVEEVKVQGNDIESDSFDEDDDKCLIEFKSEKSELTAAPQDCTDTTIREKTQPEPDFSVVNGQKPNKRFKSKKCEICKKVFNKKGWLSRHMKAAHSETKTEIEKPCKKEVKKETKDLGDEKGEIRCRVCGKQFTSKAWRTKHLNEEHSQSVQGERIFLCPYCPKTFSKYSHMYYHTTSHPDVAKHPCGVCGKEYRIRKELDQHRRTHLKERPYACDQCDMRFKMKGILVTHLKWHSGIRPYLCSICGRSFIQSGNLESHMRVHTGEKPFACGQCAFRSTSRVSLKRHTLRHRGERPYPCSYCPKRFYESSSLTRHIRSHTRERPYRCPYCSRDFNDSGKRRRHFIMTHKMAPDEIPPMDKDGAPVERTAQNCVRKQLLNNSF